MQNTCERTEEFSDVVALSDELINAEACNPGHITAHEIKAVRAGGDEAEAIYRRLRRERTARKLMLRRRSN